MTTADINSITQLYVTYLNRAPDPSGLDYWLGQANQGISLETIAADFGETQEAKNEYSYLAFPNTSDPTAFVNLIYLNAFGRNAEQAGLDFWVNQLKTQGSGIASTFIFTLTQNALNDDKIALQNKVSIATQFTNGLLSNNIKSPTSEIFADSTNILDRINATTASVTAGQLLINPVITNNISKGTADTGIVIPSGAIALTTSIVDNLTATADNDTFIGINNAVKPADNQVQATDEIDGGLGTDTFQYIGASGTADVPTLLNVEKVELLNPTTGTVIDFTGKTTGLQQVTIKGLANVNLNAFTAKGLSGITLGVEGVTPTTIVTLLTADFGSTTTSANLSIKDAVVTTADLNTGTINAALTTLNIAADGLGSNSIGALILPTATTSLKITGVGTLDLGTTTPTTVSTIDASANTGGINVIAGAGVNTLTGGSGVDLLSGGAGADILSGSAGDDILFGGDGADILTGGAGADNFFYNAFTDSAVTNTTMPTGFDTISDFTEVDDILKITGFAATNLIDQTTVQAAVNAAAPANLGNALAAAATQVAASKFGVFQYSGTTYVFGNDATATVGATDLVIELTGLHTLTAANFSA
ncbi:MAG: DUF4214 domain-containing protein [Nostoc sp.]|uniref:DUF4214 domain-containing protein n=1 Tax=Nostoc sp. TaxID=1180 RepID=UPI002FFD51E2